MLCVFAANVPGLCIRGLIQVYLLLDKWHHNCGITQSTRYMALVTKKWQLSIYEHNRVKDIAAENEYNIEGQNETDASCFTWEIKLRTIAEVIADSLKRSPFSESLVEILWKESWFIKGITSSSGWHCAVFSDVGIQCNQYSVGKEDSSWLDWSFIWNDFHLRYLKSGVSQHTQWYMPSSLWFR